MGRNTNLKLTLEAWADIVIKQWEAKIIKKNIIDTSALLNSFSHHIFTNAGGDPERIEFAFLYYGKMVDMGVGNGVEYQNLEAMQGANMTKRKKKSWYKGTWYFQIDRLVVILEEKFARKGGLAITESIIDL